VRVESAARGEPTKRLAIGAPDLRMTAADLTGSHADDRELFDQHQVHRRLRPPPAGETDTQDAATEVDTAHRLVKDVTAHRVEDQVGAASAGDLLDPLAEAAEPPVRQRVVDHVIGTARLHHR